MSTTSNARGRATARAIEVAAVRLASEHGAAALTVDQICAEAGVKQRTFFNHFPTKEDALLGSELPALDEQRVREYLSDPHAPVLTGVIGLVDVPGAGDELTALRMQVLASAPTLAERQATRLRPLALEVQGIVRLKLQAIEPDMDDADLDVASALITQLASTLLLQADTTGEGSPLDTLRRVWGRLL